MAAKSDEKINASVTITIPDDVLKSLVAAAEFTGATLSQFVMQAAREKAQQLMDRENFIPITADDAAMLVELIENPPPPNRALLEAFKRSKA